MPGRGLSALLPGPEMLIDAVCCAMLQYCDLAHDAQLALTVWRAGEGGAPAPLGGATLRLFSKKGRLKGGRQDLALWPGRCADVAWPPATPAKLPVAQRGELGCRPPPFVGLQRTRNPSTWCGHPTI